MQQWVLVQRRKLAKKADQGRTVQIDEELFSDYQ